MRQEDKNIDIRFHFGSEGVLHSKALAQLGNRIRNIFSPEEYNLIVANLPDEVKSSMVLSGRNFPRLLASYFLGDRLSEFVFSSSPRRRKIIREVIRDIAEKNGIPVPSGYEVRRRKGRTSYKTVYLQTVIDHLENSITDVPEMEKEAFTYVVELLKKKLESIQLKARN